MCMCIYICKERESERERINDPMQFIMFYIMKPGWAPRGVCTTNFQFLFNYYVSLI